jgi:hypothetical protein
MTRTELLNYLNGRVIASPTLAYFSGEDEVVEGNPLVSFGGQLRKGNQLESKRGVTVLVGVY